MVEVAVDSTAGPWSYEAGGLNSAFQYGVGNQAGPVIVSGSNGLSFAAGGVFTIRYLSGTTSANVDDGFALVDASGNKDFVTNDQANGSTGTYFPSRYVAGAAYPVYLSELIGTFADDSGAIVGNPFAVGDLLSVAVPAGATRLQLGINDEYFTDNSGSLLVSITGPDVPASPVPGPASAVPLALGMMGLIGVRRREAKSRRGCPRPAMHADAQ